MTDLQLQAAYAGWRFEMWAKGFGSYNDIERGVEEGKYTPGIIPDVAPTPEEKEAEE